MKTIVQGLLILNYKFITGGYQKQPDQTGCDRDKLIYKILRFFHVTSAHLVQISGNSRQNPRLCQ